MTEFDRIRNSGRLAYEYIRGSRLYNLNTPASDVDTGGIGPEFVNSLMIEIRTRQMKEIRTRQMKEIRTRQMRTGVCG